MEQFPAHGGKSLFTYSTLCNIHFASLLGRGYFTYEQRSGGNSFTVATPFRLAQLPRSLYRRSLLKMDPQYSVRFSNGHNRYCGVQRSARICSLSAAVERSRNYVYRDSFYDDVAWPSDNDPCIYYFFQVALDSIISTVDRPLILL